MFSLARSSGTIELYLEDVETGPVGPDDVIVRIDAAPINPSDLAALLGPARLDTLQKTGPSARPGLVASLPEASLSQLAHRLDVPLPVGNEGAGEVVDAGPNVESLLGKTVSLIGREMFAQFIRVPANVCHVLPAGLTPVQGASSLINPMAVLGMIETMRADGSSALVHTAAASNLGQMLNRLCLEDGIPLVNIVRNAKQEDLLRGQGAEHVCNSASSTFLPDLRRAVDATQATLAFDAIGGGSVLGSILEAMETSALSRATQFNRYGSMTLKKVYVYGSLDSAPITFSRSFEFAWSVSGWLLPTFMATLPPGRAEALWDVVASRLKTTFSSRYVATLSLEEALRPELVSEYTRRATGEKYLIEPPRAPA